MPGDIQELNIAAPCPQVLNPGGERDEQVPAVQRIQVPGGGRGAVQGQEDGTQMGVGVPGSSATVALTVSPEP